jgi:hypothetical protein
VETSAKFAVGFAITGFAIGAVLCAYTFYVTSSHCPPSFAAMALDNAGVVGGLIGWLFISLMNAVLYGAIGLGFGLKVEKKEV